MDRKHRTYLSIGEPKLFIGVWNACLIEAAGLFVICAVIALAYYIFH